MEHRHGARLALDLPVMIDALPQGHGRGKVVEANLAGVSIRTTMELPPYLHAQLRFIVRDGNILRMDKLEAVVVRRFRDGLALEWLDPAAPTITDLLAGACCEVAHLVAPALPGTGTPA